MRVGFVGAGTLTKTFGRHVINAGHAIVVSNSRGPETLTGLVADLALADSSSSHSSRRVGSIASLFVGAAMGALLLRLGLAVPLMVAAVGVLGATAYAGPPWNKVRFVGGG